MNKLAAIILCVAGSAAIATAQTNKVTTVVVSSQNGEAVPGASVTVTGSNISTTTDINGKFTIDAPAEYKTLTISHNDFQPTTINIQPDPIVMTPAKKIIKGFGIELGYVSSSWSYDESDEDEAKSTSGFTLGVTYDYPINSIPNFSILGGLFYVPKGISMFEGEETYNANYLELQALAKYKISLPVLNNELNVFALAGPYVAFGVGGSIDIETEEGKEDDMFEDLSTFDIYKRFDAGLVLGLGVNYRNYSLTFRYGLGLTNIFDKEKYAETILEFNGNEKGGSSYDYLKDELISEVEDINVKNRTFMITLGYRF